MRTKEQQTEEEQGREPTAEELDIAVKGIIAIDAAAIERRDEKIPARIGIKLTGKSGDFLAYRCNVSSCAREGQYQGGKK